ncbi:polysaccharide biosynthesis tyrosine autokinase [Miltoncostaea marina]|uniref:polysaccharide biosynthesis tyrosine autokinase n=1 Tax=Miltoncostaea marina TaxID=2843215 RepID=UPI001C3DAD68|nr:polysaccharide biosynthesis tyrosine autokinase [Miltoncostaea marina]
MTFNGMNPPGPAGRSERGWLREPEHRGGLARYLAIARDHWRLMLVLTACVVGAAVLAVQLTSKSYEAEALLTVSPVSSQDPRFDGISVIRETSVPGRDVETLARYVRTIPVAQRAAATEGVGGDPQQLLSTITATPIGGSYLVSVSATADSAERAAAVANAFANGTVEVRSAQFREQVNTLIDRINAQLAESGPALPESTRQSLTDRIAQLEALRQANDPSVQLGTQATVPDSPTTPELKLVVAIALVVGLLIAFGGAVAVDTASSRVRTEGQLTERFNLPVLARVPKGRTGAVASSLAADAYRDLAQGIAVLRRDPHRPRSLLFTSAGDGESRTASAIETARTLADAGQRVLLVDADLRQPAVTRALGLTTSHGTGSVLMGRAPLEGAVVEIPGFRGRLEVLGGADADSSAAVVAMSPAIVGQLLDDAATRADFIIFDAAPLGAVADALPIATTVDDVIVVIRRGETELSALSRLADVLVRHDIVPRGLCIVGWTRRSRRRGADDTLIDQRGDGRTPARRTVRAESSEPRRRQTRTR